MVAQAAARTFIDGTLAELDAAEADAREAQRAFEQLRSYLNGTGDKSDMKDFFGILTRFATDLAKAHTENKEMDTRVSGQGCVAVQSLARHFGLAHKT